MDDIQEAYTRYMVRRVSLRRTRNGDLNSTNEDLKIKYPRSTQRGSSSSMEDDRPLEQTHYFSARNSKYMQNCCSNNNEYEKSFDNSSCDAYEKSIEKLSWPNDDSSYHSKSFELSDPKIWKPLKNIANEESKKYCRNTDKSSEYCPVGKGKFQEEPTRLLRVQEFEIVPPKMMAELTNIEKSDNIPFLDNISKDTHQTSITSLAEAIENLDAQIKNLETRNLEKTYYMENTQSENSKRIYPVLENMRLDSTRNKSQSKKGYQNYENFTNQNFASSSENFPDSEREDYENFVTREITDKTIDSDMNSRINEFRDNEKSRDDEILTKKDKSEEDGLLYQETPRMARKIPIMESTRKSLLSDSTKIKFPTPSRIDPNSLSTIGNDLTSEILNLKHEENGKGAVFNESVPYEVEHFLEDALGDELFNSTNMTYGHSEARDRTNSHFNASELISHDRTPLHRRIMQALRPPMTEQPSKNFNTLDRSMQLYRSFSQRIKKKFRSGIKSRENPSMDPSLPPSVCRETDKIRQLLQEVNVQQTLMNQATKALNLCNTMKEFIDSPERIESERLLLLASLRRKCVVEEIKKITSDENSDEKVFNGQRGEITIGNIALNLNESIKVDTTEDETIDWFVLIISQGSRVWATCPMSRRRSKDSKIIFPDIISIPDLMPSFKIHIEVYTMKVRKTTYNHEEKYRIDRKHRRSTSCPPCPNILVSPTKLLKKNEGPCLSPKIHYTHGIKNKNTCFVLSGFVELFLHDLTLSSPWPLMLVPANSILQGTIDLNLACRLHLSASHEGFVNDADEAGGFAIWNRRWCVLEGHALMFWNYPREQETKQPLKIIDLIDCVSRKITTADRTICAKPRTLLFETVRPKIASDRNSMIVECRTGCTIVRNLISLDTVRELMEWSTKLNHVIMALREWNVIRVKTETRVSEL